jgi:hypothetical protein
MGRARKHKPCDKRCGKEGCDKGVLGGTGFCAGHGGGKRRGKEGCDKGALLVGGTGFCTGHGGGTRSSLGLTDRARAAPRGPGDGPTSMALAEHRSNLSLLLNLNQPA